MRRETAMTHYVRKGIKEREGRGNQKGRRKRDRGGGGEMGKRA